MLNVKLNEQQVQKKQQKNQRRGVKLFYRIGYFFQRMNFSKDGLIYLKGHGNRRQNTTLAMSDIRK